ncbi:MAG TPA: Gfo/Idh/MocA family oxidoreductase [bacterium]
MAQLNVGLLGCGHIAAAHVRAWRRSGVAEIAAVFDVRPEAARVFAARFGVGTVADSVADLISCADVVDDCSPPQAHLSNALTALGARRHYLVEKPIVLSTAEFEQIQAASQAAGRHICVVHNLKYNFGVRTARRWVAEGRIGRVISLERYFLTDPATDRMLRLPNHWSQSLPGGRWLETLPHELYLTHEFMGALPVTDVVARGSSGVGGPNTADELLVVLAGRDALATFRYSARSRSNTRSLVLYGTDGIIRVEILAGSAVLLRPHAGRWIRGVGGETLDALTTLARMVPDRAAVTAARVWGRTPHAELIADFAHSLLGRRPSPVPMDEIAYVVAGCEEVSRRARVAQAAGAS